MRRLRETSKPNLSFIILVSFVLSFVVARVFTAFFPSTVLVVRGFHVHHFWYGLALLTIGGWMGINYREDHIEKIAATLFGIGGGLVGDEIGLLITFGDYNTEITYTFVVALLAFALMAYLFKRHGPAILSELLGSFRSNMAFYVGVFLAFLSLAFFIQSDDFLVTVASGIACLVAFGLIIRGVIRFFKR